VAAKSRALRVQSTAGEKTADLNLDWFKKRKKRSHRIAGFAILFFSADQLILASHRASRDTKMCQADEHFTFSCFLILCVKAAKETQGADKKKKKFPEEFSYWKETSYTEKKLESSLKLSSTLWVF
jgi:hypothetical protein